MKHAQTGGGMSAEDNGRAPDRPRSSPDALWAGLVTEMASMPDVVANLLHEHRPNDRGFCTGNGCGTAGRGVPSTRWPCSLHTLATAAAERLQAR